MDITSSASLPAPAFAVTACAPPASLAALDAPPARAGTVHVLPIRIEGGSAGPLRATAVLPEAGR